MLETISFVEENHLLGPSYGLLRLKLDQSLYCLPGQFVMVRPQKAIEPLLRRAMAVYRLERREEGASIELLYQILGRGTEQLALLRPGDGVHLLGPLGNGFLPETWPVTDQRAILVAGGIGSAGLLLLAERFAERSIETILFFGARTAKDLVGLEDFQRLRVEIIRATDDGSSGARAFVTGPLESYLAQDGERARIYACGPEPMMKRVAEIARRYCKPCYVSLEARMACGFGVCIGCVAKISCDAEPGYSYKRVCVEGPVFAAEEVIWENV